MAKQNDAIIFSGSVPVSTQSRSGEGNAKDVLAVLKKIRQPQLTPNSPDQKRYYCELWRSFLSQLYAPKTLLHSKQSFETAEVFESMGIAIASMLSTTTTNRNASQENFYYITDYIYNILQLASWLDVAGYISPEQEFIDLCESENVVWNNGVIDEQSFFQANKLDIETLIRAVDSTVAAELRALDEQTSPENTAPQTTQPEETLSSTEDATASSSDNTASAQTPPPTRNLATAGVPLGGGGVANAGTTTVASTAPSANTNPPTGPLVLNLAEKIGSRNAKAWEEYYTLWVTNKILIDEFYQGRDPRDLKNTDPALFAQFREMVIAQVHSRLHSQYSVAELANLSNADSIRLTILQQVKSDIRSPRGSDATSISPQLTQTYRQLTQSARPIIPEADPLIISSNLDDPSQELQTGLSKARIDPVTAARVQKAAQDFIAEHSRTGSTAFETLIQMPEGELTRFLASHGIPDEVLASGQAPIVEAFLRGYVANHHTNQGFTPEDFHKNYGDLATKYEKSSPDDRAAWIGEALGLPASDPQVVSLSQQPELPTQLLFSELGQAGSPTSLTNTPTSHSPVVSSTVPISQLKKQQAQQENTTTMLPGTMAGLLADVLDPADIDAIAQHAIDPEKTVTTVASEIGRLTEAKNPQEYVQAVQKANLTAKDIWEKDGEKLLRQLNPSYTPAQIQEELQKGVPSWLMIVSAAHLNPNSEYATTAHHILKTTQDVSQTAQTRWREIQQKGSALEYLQFLHPELDSYKLQDFLRFDTPPPELTAFLIEHDNDLTRTSKFIREARDSAFELANKTLSETDMRNLALKHGQFASREEFEQFMSSDKKYSLLAKLLAEKQTGTSILQEARNYVPAPQELWSIASVQERQQLAEKALGPAQASVVSSHAEVPLEVANALFHFNGRTEQLTQANTLILQESHSQQVNQRLASDPTFAKRVRAVIAELSPAEQQTILSLRLGGNGNTSEQLTMAVATQLSLGAQPEQLFTTLRHSSAHPVSEFFTAPVEVQESIRSLFSNSAQPDAETMAFVLKHGTLHQAVKATTKLKHQLASLSPETQYSYMTEVLGFSPDQAAQNIKQGNTQWLLEVTNYGNRPSALAGYTPTPQSLSRAKWTLMSPEQRTESLAQLGISGSVQVINSPIPPPEFTVLTSFSPEARAPLTASALFQQLDPAVKERFADALGLVGAKKQEFLLADTPPAEFVAQYHEHHGNIKSLLGSMQPGVLRLVPRETVEKVGQLVGAYQYKSDEEGDLAAEEAQLGVKRGGFKKTKRITHARRAAIASTQIFNSLTPEEQDAVLVACGQDPDVVGKKRRGDLGLFGEWANTIIGMDNDPTRILGLADAVKKGKLGKVTTAIEQATEERKPTVVAKVVESMPAKEQAELFDVLGLAGDSKAQQKATRKLLTLTLAKINPAMAGPVGDFLEKISNQEDQQKQDLVKILFEYYAAQTPGAKQTALGIFIQIQQVNDYHREVTRLQEEIILLRLSEAFYEEAQYEAILNEKLAEMEQYNQALSAWVNVQYGNIPPELLAQVDPAYLVASEEVIDDMVTHSENYEPEVTQQMAQAGALPTSRFGNWRRSMGQKVANRFGITPRSKMKMAFAATKNSLLKKAGKSAVLKALMGAGSGPVGWGLTAINVLRSKQGRKIVAGTLGGVGLTLLSSPSLMGAALGAGIGMSVGGPVGALVGGGIGYGVGKAAEWLGFGKRGLGNIGSTSASSLSTPGMTTTGGAPTPPTPALSDSLQAKLSRSSTFSGETMAGAEPVVGDMGVSEAGSAGGLGAEVGTTDALAGQQAVTGQALSTASTLASAKAVAASVVSSMVGISILAPMLMFLFSGAMAIYFILVISGAFIAPLPTGEFSSDTRTVSEYVMITKKVLPTSLENNHGETTVSYQISITPRQGATLTITNLTDTLSFNGGADASNPIIILPDGNALPAGPNPLLTIESLASPEFSTPQRFEYSLVVRGGTDVLVGNTLAITFSVAKSDGTTLTNLTASHRTNLRIGNPQVECWPSTGKLVQGPYGPYSHGAVDGYDIAGGSSVKRPIYAPVDGVIVGVSETEESVYGYNVILKFDEVTKNGKTGTGYMYFSHMPNRSVIPVSKGDRVSVGDMLGIQGTTGRSDGIHLHWELRNHYTDGNANPNPGGLTLNDFVDTSNIVVNKDNVITNDVWVTSCYD